MHDPHLWFMSMIHVIGATIHRIAPEPDTTQRDRGAVSIETVLWYAAAAISVAVVAGIIWTQIKSTAGSEVKVPTAP